MRTIGLLLLAAGMGCSTSASTATTASAPTPSTQGEELALTAPTPGHLETREAPDAALPEFDAEQLASLPEAPWSEAPLAVTQAPADLLAAWARAENRDWCAPIAPAALREVAARAHRLDGGWGVEFDQAGMPGVDEEGELCAECGRGTFGIAGTAMGVDDMMDTPAPSFADGSAADVAPVEGGVAAATIAIRGQGCVYQVWSFLGEEHLESLVGQLRFVAVQPRGDAQVAGLDLPF